MPAGPYEAPWAAHGVDPVDAPFREVRRGPSRARRLADALPWNPLAIVAAWIAGLGVLAGALAIGWWYVQPQVNKPFVYDEADFAFAPPDSSAFTNATFVRSSRP